MSEDMLFILRDAFTITGRGTVLAGDLVAGSVAIGDDVVVTGPGGETRVVRIAGVERDRRLLDHAAAGPGQVGLLVDGLDKNDVVSGSSVRPAVVSPAAASTAVPAAWLADPTGRHQLRYWDGTAWTGHVADAGIAAEDPLASTTPAAAELEWLRARVTEVLTVAGPGVFAHLKLDIDPTQIPERVISLGAELERATRPGKALDVLHQRGAIFQALGMQTEADRDRLAWAAIKEGHSGLSRTSREWAAGIFGLAHGSTFVAAYDLSVKDEGKKVRVPLMRAGRAVALGYCPKCGSVQQLDERLKCPRGHSGVQDIACVVPPDVEETRAALQTAHPGI
jgi:hypothetical protein